LKKCRELAHLPDVGRTLLGRTAQQISTFAFDAASEVEERKKQAEVIAEAVVHRVEDFRVVGGFLDEEDEISLPKTLHTDGADPFFPNAEVSDRYARHNPGALGQPKCCRRKLDVDVVEGQKRELALVLEFMLHHAMLPCKVLLMVGRARDPAKVADLV
jgi:hypothetical protein